MGHRTYTTPIRSTKYVEQIERIRKALGISQSQAAERMNAGCATWNRVALGRGRGGYNARPTFDMIAAMADALGHVVVIVPADEVPPETAPRVEPAPFKRPDPPAVLPVDRGRGEASTRSATIMAWLRDTRQALGIRHDAMSKRLGIGEHRLSAYEHGKREPAFGDVARYAEECGLSVALVEPEAVPLAALAAKPAEAVRSLVVSYVNHCVREGKPIPAGLLDAAEALDNDN